MKNKRFTLHFLREQDKIYPASFRKKAGFTLIETVVAVAIFSLLISAVSGIFVFFLKAQKHSLATQEVLSQTSYAMEYMSKALRMARKDDLNGTCTIAGTPKLNYAFVSQCIRFRNYYDQCQEFCLDGVKLKEIKDGNENYLTSGNLTVNNFNIGLTGQQQTDSLQPKVIIFLDVSGKEQSNIKIQTTISQRNLDIRK